MRAVRLSIVPKLQDRARSLLITQRAVASARSGMVDIDGLQRAVELDPDNRRAKELLIGAQQPGTLRAHSTTVRWISSAVIGAIGLLAVLFVSLRRGSQLVESTTATADGNGRIENDREP